jgi:hypothetical protein
MSKPFHFQLEEGPPIREQIEQLAMALDANKTGILFINDIV